MGVGWRILVGQLVNSDWLLDLRRAELIALRELCNKSNILS